MNRPIARTPTVAMQLCSRSDNTYNYAWQYFLALAEPHPERRHACLPGTHAPRRRVPTDASIRFAVETDFLAAVVMEGEGYVATIMANPQETTIEVAADNSAHAVELLETICASTSTRPSESVDVTLWRYNGESARSWSRSLAAPTWDSIARNYPRCVSDELEVLMRLTGVNGTGRLMLWTGDPGTGKTSAIRALLRAWHPWCRGQLIADPERFFGDAAYLLEVMSSPSVRVGHPRLDVDSEGPVRWNLVICEDADDFIRVDTRRHTGAGVGRLLNLADGLLGQGLNSIVLLTSNTPARELDPALLRPGRCLANTGFSRFSTDEARAWLGDPLARAPDEGLTLAELYELSGELSRYGHTESHAASVGNYL